MSKRPHFTYRRIFDHLTSLFSFSKSGRGNSLRPDSLHDHFRRLQRSAIPGAFAIYTLVACGGSLQAYAAQTTGGTPQVSSFYCTTQTPARGAGTDICRVNLHTASSVAVMVALSSNNAAVVVPATVTVPAKAATTTFTATLASVLTNQTATLTASVAGNPSTSVLQLSAATRGLTVSATSLNFNDVSLQNSSTQSVTLRSTGTLPITINTPTMTGAGFSTSGVTFPVVLQPYQSTTLSVQFAPRIAGAVTGALSFTSNSTSNTPSNVALSGTGGTPQLSGFGCTTQTPPLGAGTDICMVKLNAVSSNGGVVVALSSNNAAVVVPATVTVPQNTAYATFTATISSVLTNQTVTLAASVGGGSSNSVLQLSAATRGLSVSATRLSFQNVALSSSSTQSLILRSTGTQPIAITAPTVTGTGFSTSGVTFPVTLQPYQSTTLNVVFAPTVAGPATGGLSFTTNSTANTPASVALSGIGGTPQLSAFYCTTQTPARGAGTDVCTMKLSTVSAAGAVTIALSSDNAAVVVPATVTVPQNVAYATFTATLSSVLTDQTATLAASAGSSSSNSLLKLSAATQGLSVSATSLNFNDVSLNSSSSQALTLRSTGTVAITINAPTVTGSGFSTSGVAFPVTLQPYQSATLNVQFAPTLAGAVAGALSFTSTSTSGTAVSVTLSGTGGTPQLTAFGCTTQTPARGAGTDICMVKLNAVSSNGGVTVTLSSNNAAVVVPATVTVPQNTAYATFTATLSSVLTDQAATLAASVGGSSSTSVLQLRAYTQLLSLSRTSIVFQDVLSNSTASQSVTLTSTGTEPVTINSASLTGSGFSTSGGSFPITLQPSQSATFNVKFAPTAKGMFSGQLVIASDASSNAVSTISVSGQALAGVDRAGNSGTFDYTDSSLVGSLAPDVNSTGILPDFFGMTIIYLSPNSTHPAPNMTPFPTLPVSTMRLEDVSYWGMVQAYQGEQNWAKLDTTVSIGQQNGVSDFIFNFYRPPVWASTNPTDPCTGGEGPGTCDFPDMDAFDAFATQVVQRYCGKIKYYEPWNEPNNPQFWHGTNIQMLTIAEHVYKIAKDPANCGCTDGSCSANGGANPNQVLLPPVSDLEQDSGIAWLNSYLTDAGTPYPYADVAAFHGYLWQGYQPEEIVTRVQNFKQTLASFGLSKLPVWNDEVSFELDSNLAQPDQAGWLLRYHALQAALGVSRVVWYAYDRCTWGTLWSSPLCSATQTPAGQLTDAGVAYGTVENWFIGAALPLCQQYENGLWACALQRSGGYSAWMLWSSTGKSISVTVPSTSGLTTFRDWQNNVNPLSTSITVTQLPVLLEN